MSSHDTGEPAGSATSERPRLRVVNPDATPEEVAALVAVFSALGGRPAPRPRRRAPEWNAPHRLVNRPHLSGPGGWRASGLPR